MRYFNNKSGFTIVELMITMGLFVIVVSIAVGGVVNALRTQRQVAAFIGANTNTTLALEQAAREIRTGFNFCIGVVNVPCDTGTLGFTNAKNEPVVYRYNAAAQAFERQVNGGAFQPLVSDTVNIRSVTFVLMGNLPTDGLPPRITISIGVTPKAAGLGGNIINFQTTISARRLDG